MLEPGHRLPSVRALARQLGVNVNTVRSAYARPETDGMVQTRHGVGTVVMMAVDYGLSLGLRQVFSGPFVRSSYMADLVSEQAQLCS